MIRQRSHYCGEIRETHLGQTITVCGWVDRKRDAGGLVFIDLRDIKGKLQLVFDGERNPELLAATKEARGEYVLAATGVVRMRESANDKLPTGKVEVKVSEFEVLNTAKTPAIEVKDEIKVDPEIRLTHRFIDLRRAPMQRMLQARAKLIAAARATLDGEGFTDVETPVLYKRTPEGARDFIVPSRAHKGSFYALPQSPQLFKQLLMIAGMDRYYQIARCFRDEDKRADRQLEFTQIDLEMSFVRREDVMALFEKVVTSVVKSLRDDERFSGLDWPVLGGAEVAPPFERISYDDAMRAYSIDRPDLRSKSLKLTELNGVFANSAFNAFKSTVEGGGLIKGLRCPGLADGFSRGQLGSLEKEAKGMGAHGLSWLRVGESGALDGPIAKFLPEGEQDALKAELKAESGDLLLICGHLTHRITHAVMHHMRIKVAEKLGLHDPKAFAICWVVDFPLFEYREEEEKLYASHHPFTMPQDVELLAKLAEASRSGEGETPMARLKAAGLGAEVLGMKNMQYDLVINGVEAAGGSIRMHRPELQEHVFELIGIGKAEAEKKFGFLLKALAHGAPPHGGIASGVDRVLMLLLGLDNIQDVIAFPKSAGGKDLMIDTPNEVEPALLDELGISIVLRED